MSFFAALNTSASGMLAQGKSTSMVSQNIANLTTTGYKKSHAAFVVSKGDCPTTKNPFPLIDALLVEFVA